MGSLYITVIEYPVLVEDKASNVEAAENRAAIIKVCQTNPKKKS